MLFFTWWAPVGCFENIKIHWKKRSIGADLPWAPMKIKPCVIRLRKHLIFTIPKRKIWFNFVSIDESTKNSSHFYPFSAPVSYCYVKCCATSIRHQYIFALFFFFFFFPLPLFFSSLQIFPLTALTIFWLQF